MPMDLLTFSITNQKVESMYLTLPNVNPNKIIPERFNAELQLFEDGRKYLNIMVHGSSSLIEKPSAILAELTEGLECFKQEYFALLENIEQINIDGDFNIPLTVDRDRANEIINTETYGEQLERWKLAQKCRQNLLQAIKNVFCPTGKQLKAFYANSFVPRKRCLSFDSNSQLTKPLVDEIKPAESLAKIIITNLTNNHQKSEIINPCDIEDILTSKNIIKPIFSVYIPNAVYAKIDPTKEAITITHDHMPIVVKNNDTIYVTMNHLSLEEHFKGITVPRTHFNAKQRQEFSNTMLHIFTTHFITFMENTQQPSNLIEELKELYQRLKISQNDVNLQLATATAEAIVKFMQSFVINYANDEKLKEQVLMHGEQFVKNIWNDPRINTQINILIQDKIYTTNKYGKKIINKTKNQSRFWIEGNQVKLNSRLETKKKGNIEYLFDLTSDKTKSMIIKATMEYVTKECNKAWNLNKGGINTILSAFGLQQCAGYEMDPSMEDLNVNNIQQYCRAIAKLQIEQIPMMLASIGTQPEMICTIFSQELLDKLNYANDLINRTTILSSIGCTPDQINAPLGNQTVIFTIIESEKHYNNLGNSLYPEISIVKGNNQLLTNLKTLIAANPNYYRFTELMNILLSKTETVTANEEKVPLDINTTFAFDAIQKQPSQLLENEAELPLYVNHKEFSRLEMI